MAFAFLSLMKGEPLLSKLAVLSQYVAYPSVMLTYCAYVPEKPLTTSTPAMAAASADK